MGDWQFHRYGEPTGVYEMVKRNPTVRRIIGRVATVLLIVALVYLGLGLGFHLAWKSAQADCMAERAARGEFVEPEVFGGALGLAFDVTWWPVYIAANVRHFGMALPTPCTRPGSTG